MEHGVGTSAGGKSSTGNMQQTTAAPRHFSCVFVRRFASRDCWSGKQGCSFTSTSVRFELNSRRPVAASSAAVLVRPRGDTRVAGCSSAVLSPMPGLLCYLYVWRSQNGLPPSGTHEQCSLRRLAISAQATGLLAHVLKIWFLNLPCSLTPLTKPRASREEQSAGATAVVGSIGRTPTANTTGLCLGA